MKLWFKIFLFVFILFIVAFYTGIFFMSDLSYKTSLDTARNQAFAEYNFISLSLFRELTAIIERNPDAQAATYDLISSYNRYYQNHDVFLKLSNDDFTFGNLPVEKGIESIMDASDNIKSMVMTENRKKYILVAGEIPNNYFLIYAHDITSLTDAQNELSKTLLVASIIITLVFIIALYFLIKKLTKPIIDLQNVTKQITEGNLRMRAQIKGHDEISTLAEHFNEMTEEVVSKIEEHKNISLQKQQFIDNLAHELKTPLTSIYGYTQLLQNTKISEKDLINYTSHIIYDVNRIQSMSKKLLDLALNRDIILDLKAIDLNELFLTLKNEFLAQLQGKNIELILFCDAREIFGDPVLIENLFANLLDNAIKSSNYNSKIYLSSEKQDNIVTIIVRDEGIGIAKEHLQYIFEPFYRTDFARSSSKGGAGLGLSLCKQIAEAHKAKIHFESELNVGTKAIVSFTTS